MQVHRQEQNEFAAKPHISQKQFESMLKCMDGFSRTEIMRTWFL